MQTESVFVAQDIIEVEVETGYLLLGTKLLLAVGIKLFPLLTWVILTAKSWLPEPVIVKLSHSKREGKIDRNNPCPCGSGKKYKYCCGKDK